MNKIIKRLAITAAVASTLLLTACSNSADSPLGNVEGNPNGGRWVATQIGDVWCVEGTDYATDSYACQWSSLTAKGIHKGAPKADGSYHYLITEDKRQQKVFCIENVVRGYTALDCNFPTLVR